MVKYDVDESDRWWMLSCRDEPGLKEKIREFEFIMRIFAVTDERFQ